MSTVIQPDELATIVRDLQRRLRSLESGNQATFVLGGNFGYQMVDATHNARCRFLIPPTSIHTGRATLNFSLQPFRAAIQSATGGGTTSGAEGSHTHGVTLSTHTHDTTPAAHSHSTPNHNHLLATTRSSTASVTASGAVWRVKTGDSVGALSFILPGTDNTEYVDLWTDASAGGSTSGGGGGTTTTSAGGGGGSLSSAGGSAHTHTVPSSGLTTPNALYEASMAQGCHVLVDGTDQTVALGGPWGVGGALDVNDLDLSPWLASTGWHEVQVTSTALGGVFAQVAVYATLNG